MASNVLENNGYQKTPPRSNGYQIKIVVVGEPGCGKSSFIKAFYNKHESDECYEDDCALVYPCKYAMLGQEIKIKIFEVVGGPDEIVDEATGKHTNANGFILMFAVDDPTSFQRVRTKWYPSLNRSEADMWLANEPAIVVGNKIDLRENPLVIQRLARENQAPVTEEQGKSLVQDKIRKYFDCSSTQEYMVDDAFQSILAWGLEDLKNVIFEAWYDQSYVEDS